MNKVKKAIVIAGLAFVAAAAALTLKPVRASASVVGSWMYSQFVISNAAHTVSVRFLGPLSAKPATSQEGDTYYDTTQHTVCMATATKTDNSAWLKANTATTGAPWTLY